MKTIKELETMNLTEIGFTSLRTLEDVYEIICKLERSEKNPSIIIRKLKEEIRGEN